MDLSPSCCAPVNGKRCEGTIVNGSKHCEIHYKTATKLYKEYKRICNIVEELDITPYSKDKTTPEEKVNHLLKCYNLLTKAYEARMKHRNYAFTFETRDRGHDYQFVLLSQKINCCEASLEALYKSYKQTEENVKEENTDEEDIIEEGDEEPNPFLQSQRYIKYLNKSIEKERKKQEDKIVEEELNYKVNAFKQISNLLGFKNLSIFNREDVEDMGTMILLKDHNGIYSSMLPISGKRPPPTSSMREAEKIYNSLPIEMKKEFDEYIEYYEAISETNLFHDPIEPWKKDRLPTKEEIFAIRAKRRKEKDELESRTSQNIQWRKKCIGHVISIVREMFSSFNFNIMKEEEREAYIFFFATHIMIRRLSMLGYFELSIEEFKSMMPKIWSTLSAKKGGVKLEIAKLIKEEKEEENNKRNKKKEKNPERGTINGRPFYINLVLDKPPLKERPDVVDLLDAMDDPMLKTMCERLIRYKGKITPLMKDFTFFYTLYGTDLFTNTNFVLIWDPAKERLVMEQKPANMEYFYDDEEGMNWRL